MSLVINGTFWREMSLEDFPLDIQLLEVKIRFPHGKDRTRIERLRMDETGNACVLDEGAVANVRAVLPTHVSASDFWIFGRLHRFHVELRIS